MRISDWSSDVCSSDLQAVAAALKRLEGAFALAIIFAGRHDLMIGARRGSPLAVGYGEGAMFLGSDALALAPLTDRICYLRSEEHTSELQSLMRITYALFCLKKNTDDNNQN